MVLRFHHRKVGTGTRGRTSFQPVKPHLEHGCKMRRAQPGCVITDDWALVPACTLAPSNLYQPWRNRGAGPRGLQPPEASCPLVVRRVCPRRGRRLTAIWTPARGPGSHPVRQTKLGPRTSSSRNQPAVAGADETSVTLGGWTPRCTGIPPMAPAYDLPAGQHVSRHYQTAMLQASPKALVPAWRLVVVLDLAPFRGA